MLILLLITALVGYIAWCERRDLGLGVIDRGATDPGLRSAERSDDVG
ncbi:hypothetical protein H0B56_12200 [Haloechinothrix sp. YIM 98757]|uniref:Uncharacterized protein n=1 Tax=Haloechinothrix aidingensis TaxID=2752311 RepID=A0A838AAN9_9PSEU|nr:hypothetical protein [Haloechinothrix aidingensis]MBA0126304.1 hypothetical protein [Haloechinothrix aidingensis]